MTSSTGPETGSDKGREPDATAPDAPAPETPVDAAAHPAAEPPATPAEPVTPPAAGRPGSDRLGLGVAAVALVVAGLAVAMPWLRPDLPAPLDAPDPDIARIEQRLTRLEQAPAGDSAVPQLAQEVAALKAEAGKPAADPRVDALQQRLAALETALGDIGRQASTASADAAGIARKTEALTGLPDAVKALTAKVEDLRTSSTAAEALVLAAGQLRLAAGGDQPFETEFKAARALGGNDPEVTAALDAVAPYAAKGVPTRNQLIARFAPLAGSVVRASHSGAGGSWIAQVEGAVSTLVTVRRTGGGVVGSTAEAVVARAEAALDAGNLAGAVAEVSTLEGPAAEAAKPWLADARARLAVDAAAGTLAQRAVALFTAVAGGTESGR